VILGRFSTLLLALFSAEAARAGDPQRHEFEAAHMGTLARVVVYSDSRAAAEQGARAALARIGELDARLSDYRADSEVSALGRASGGPAVPVSADLLALLLQAQELARRSAGAFDATVGPLSMLWRTARRRNELPSPDAVLDARARVGHAWLLLDPAARRCRLTKKGMQLDLGGIAKGYAADQALRVLRARGLPSALVTLGGEVAAGAPPPGRSGWSVALGTPGPELQPLVVHDAAVSTSGDAEQWMEAGGLRLSHVLDPRTGQPLTGRRSVTVVAKEGALADGLATALSVLGPERGLLLVEESPAAAALFVREAASGVEVVASARWALLERERR
jgi:thiamine biosynthesis lipoprotein